MTPPRTNPAAKVEGHKPETAATRLNRRARNLELKARRLMGDPRDRCLAAAAKLRAEADESSDG